MPDSLVLCVGGGIHHGSCIQWLKGFFFHSKPLLCKWCGVLHQDKSRSQRTQSCSCNCGSESLKREHLVVTRQCRSGEMFFSWPIRIRLGLMRSDLCTECWVSVLIPFNRLWVYQVRVLASLSLHMGTCQLNLYILPLLSDPGPTYRKGFPGLKQLHRAWSH